MMSGRMNNSTGSDDFPFAPTPPPSYGGFEQRALYDSFDFAAAFQFQHQQEHHQMLSLPPNANTSNLLHHPMAPPPPPAAMSMQLPIPMPQMHGHGGDAMIYPALGMAVKREGEVAEGRNIGLNLGRRTYFSPGDMMAVDRLLMRSRLGGVFGLGFGGPGGHGHHHQPPRCQAEGCKADLSGAKHYHRRHKVCEYHAKASLVSAGGKHQRFCQQCSRFHVLTEFDEAKRSCRKRLAEHNRRRRKPATTNGTATSAAKDSATPPSSKKPNNGAGGAIIGSYTVDNKTLSAAKSSTISSNTSGISCLQQQQQDQSKAAAAAALTLGGSPQDQSNAVHQLAGHGHGHHHQEQHFITSLLHNNNNNNNGNNNNILSCSSVCSNAMPPPATANNGGGEVSDQNNHHGNNNSNNMHLFEVDFM
ncbi:squamosa promoter-binding-like protein 10 [Brachypodium distachyon]|uniref:SBP-type domain-containing protein n=1 Tax=Brachypodium distachyon TaxID=15368 RepID=A0A0Q3H1V4_BRADI|nr:squamosa promoter-binding-like protein 10 [Brachypodium distachyon]KQK16912.2 hypothetical protein BRADI_1g31391v3 [Brachypodium distachyon]|eukprot:XP_003560391.1 squamosa promoter-binding-like protein 10 [Brachypodium distachyon]